MYRLKHKINVNIFPNFGLIIWTFEVFKKIGQIYSNYILKCKKKFFVFGHLFFSDNIYYFSIIFFNQLETKIKYKRF